MSSTAQVLLNRRMLATLLLGFSSGIPLALTGSTLQAWMHAEKVDLTLIGIFSLVGLPYTLKFIWAPAMDRYMPPFLGRRRGWILLTQLALIVLLSVMAFSKPFEQPVLLAILAFLVAFASASQDIVIDAYRTELLQPEEFGTGAATANMGYRLAMLFSGAFALILSDQMPWKAVYLVMAATMAVGMIVTFFAPELDGHVKLPRTLKEAVVQPFKDFFQRKGIADLLAFIILYKLDVVVAMALMTPFMLELGFTRTEIGAVSKGFGLVASISGTFVGGLWMSRIGLQRALWVFGILQGISGFTFYLLAHMGRNYAMMATTIATENFLSGMGNAAYAAFLMSLCNPQFTATQFALLSSLMALTRTVAGAPTGWLVQAVGWEMYFIVSILLAIPALLLLPRYKIWMERKEQAIPTATSPRSVDQGEDS